jgi:glycosyltransferase involved in cell wall biosynthesis
MVVRKAQHPIGVLHMTDTLDPGGAERVAVNLVNALPRDRFAVSLCTTRRDGELSDLVAGDVKRLNLGRRWTVDVGALWRLRAFIKSNNVRILHAHASSLFTAVCGSFFPPYPVVVWHDHCGYQLTAPRPVKVYRPAAVRVGGVISVNEHLADWARSELRVPRERVWYIPNFVCEPNMADPVPTLPGRPGARVVCVANLRPQKGHIDLLRALAIVIREHPDAHLLLVGREAEPTYARSIREAIREFGLDDCVTMLGERRDVGAILRQCDIGVLSSVSEGFPLALVEYGLAGLPVVTTDVGQCAEVMDGGHAGSLVPPRDPARLAAAMSQLLHSPELRRLLAERLGKRVRERYSADTVIQQVSHVYDTVIQGNAAHARRFESTLHA